MEMTVCRHGQPMLYQASVHQQLLRWLDNSEVPLPCQHSRPCHQSTCSTSATCRRECPWVATWRCWSRADSRCLLSVLLPVIFLRWCLNWCWPAPACRTVWWPGLCAQVRACFQPTSGLCPWTQAALLLSHRVRPLTMLLSVRRRRIAMNVMPADGTRSSNSVNV